MMIVLERRIDHAIALGYSRQAPKNVIFCSAAVAALAAADNFCRSGIAADILWKMSVWELNLVSDRSRASRNPICGCNSILFECTVCSVKLRPILTKSMHSDEGTGLLEDSWAQVPLKIPLLMENFLIVEIANDDKPDS
jgi:hypothetical protein